MKNTFEKWMDSHSESIERFVFQNGCTPKQAATIAEKVFETVYVNEEAISESLIYVLYQHASEHMENAVELQESIFPFEEDAALHSEITRLDETYRVPFVLHQFHKMNNEEIAHILACLPSEVVERIDTAKVLLTGDQLDKRLGFLEKSYGRLPVLFNKENVLQEKVAVESETEVKEQKTKNHKGLLTAAILGVLLIGLIAGTFFTGGEWAHKSDQKFIERLKKDFAKEVRKKQKVLGFTEEVMKDVHFIKEANDQFNEHILNLEHALEKGKKLDRNVSMTFLHDLLVSIKLPSELTNELFKSSLTKDAEASLEFITAYILQTYKVQGSIFEQFSSEFHELLEPAFNTNKPVDFDLLVSSEKYPENLRMPIEALLSQNIHPFGPFTNRQTVEGDGEFIERMQASLHASVNGYLVFYGKQPFVEDEKLAYPLNETTEFIMEMEKVLHVDRGDGELKDYLESTMIWLLSYVISGKSDESLRNADGSISESYRDAWKRLASAEKDSAVSVLMTKIIGEMEQSNWTESTVYSYLTRQEYSIYDTYSLAKEGDLDSFTPITAGFNEMYEEKVIEVPNLEEDVQRLYKEFSVAYDRDALRYVHPLLIVGLYYYANDMGDPEMMWHLMDDKARILYVEDYTIAWQPENPLLKRIDSIGFDPSLIINDGKTINVPIQFTRNGNTDYNVWMSYADDVWKIESIAVGGTITTIYP